jgi:hypothetical protein
LIASNIHSNSFLLSLSSSLLLENRKYKSLRNESIDNNVERGKERLVYKERGFLIIFYGIFGRAQKVTRQSTSSIIIIIFSLTSLNLLLFGAAATALITLHQNHHYYWVLSV